MIINREYLLTFFRSDFHLLATEPDPQPPDSSPARVKIVVVFFRFGFFVKQFTYSPSSPPPKKKKKKKKKDWIFQKNSIILPRPSLLVPPPSPAIKSDLDFLSKLTYPSPPRKISKFRFFGKIHSLEGSKFEL